jgi:protein SCO1/2
MHDIERTTSRALSFDNAATSTAVSTLNACAPRSSIHRPRRLLAHFALAVASVASLLTSSATLAQSKSMGIPLDVQVPVDVVSPQLEDIGIDQNLNAQLPMEAVFTDDYGKTVKIGDLFGQRPAVLVMVYYECPMLCNMVLNDLLRTLNGMTTLAVGQDFDVITVSINPKETPELASKKKRAYMKEYGNRGNPAGWHFLTGTEENIKQVAQTVGFRYRYDEVRKEYIHASGIMVATTDGRLARYFYGIDYSPKDLRLSLVEASNNKIGGLSNAVLLYCFHYDPSTGKYGMMVTRILKLGAGATILALGGFVLTAYVLDRRKNRLRMVPATAGKNR